VANSQGGLWDRAAD